MSAAQSDLSAAGYGYDFVVATTQASINANLKQLVYTNPGPLIAMYYCATNGGAPQPVPVTALNGIDPFSITSSTDPRIQQLASLGFVAAFQAQIGIPPGYTLSSLPDFITLQPGGIQFQLLCSQFDVISLAGGVWVNQSQPSGAAWMFSASINMTMSPMGSSTPPPAVQTQMNALAGTAFGVQELLLDLDTATIETSPTIENVAQGSAIYNVLQQDFLGQYFAALQQTGGTVLGYAVIPAADPASTLTLSAMNFQVSPYLDANGNTVTPAPPQATLNYLCAANGDTLPPPNNFTWNWVETTDSPNFDGVIAINRNTFVKYLRSQLDSLVTAGCLVPHVSVTLSGLVPEYSASLPTGGTPQVIEPPTGATVLQYTYVKTASDQAGHDGSLGQLAIGAEYAVTVTMAGQTMTITQRAVIAVFAKHLLTTASGNVVDRTITDTYTISVDEYGKLGTTMSSTTTDTGAVPQPSKFDNAFASVTGIMDSISNEAQTYVKTNLTSMPISVAQNFIFPGGLNFSYADAQFSTAQDLVAHITFVNPS